MPTGLLDEVLVALPTGIATAGVVVEVGPTDPTLMDVLGGLPTGAPALEDELGVSPTVKTSSPGFTKMDPLVRFVMWLRALAAYWGQLSIILKNLPQSLLGLFFLFFSPGNKVKK